jgi:iron complex outermembrane receptor protein
VNGTETTTKGVDVVRRYRLRGEASAASTSWPAANFNDTEVDRVPPQTAAIPQRLVDRNTILTFEEGTPGAQAGRPGGLVAREPRRHDPRGPTSRAC